MAGDDGLDNAPLEFEKSRLAVVSQQNLECGVALTLEGSVPTKPVPSGMRRVEMGAGNPAGRQWLGGRVGATMRQQLGEDVGVRASRALAVRRRDRLKNLDAPKAARKDTVRV